MTDLNKRIAELKGECWHEENYKYWDAIFGIFTCPKCGEEFKEGSHKDYSLWENCMPLFEELPIKKDLVHDSHGWWVWWEYGKSNKCPQKAETAQEAICKAWIAWKENK